MTINDKDQELIRLAFELIKKRRGEFSTVGSAIKTTVGKIYTGVNVEQIHSSPCSMCAEYSAIAQMQTEADQEIETVVAITAEEVILPPCGKCREMMRQFGNPDVILKKGDEFFKMKLDELIPFWEL